MYYFKKTSFLTVVFVLAALFTLPGCSTGPEEPGEVVEKFMAHFNEGELDKAERYVTSNAAESFSLPGQANNPGEVAQKMAEEVNVEITGKTAGEEGNKVYLSGTMIVPDLEKLFPAFMEKSLNGATGDRETLEELFLEELGNVSAMEIPFKEEIVLVKDEGELKIDNAPFLDMEIPSILGAAEQLSRMQEEMVDFYLGENDYTDSKVRELVASSIGPKIDAENGAVRVSTSHPDPGELREVFEKAMEVETPSTGLFRSREETKEYIADKLYDAVQKAIDNVSFELSKITLELSYNGGWEPEGFYSHVSNALSELGPPNFDAGPGRPENPLGIDERNYLWPVSENLQEVAAWEREGRFAFSGRPSPTKAIIHRDTVFYTYLNDGQFILEGTDINSGEEVFSDVFLHQERFAGNPPGLIKYKGMLVVSYRGGPEGPEFYHPSRGVAAYDLDTMEEVYHVKFDGPGTVTIDGDYIYYINPGPTGAVEEYTPEKYNLETGEKIWEANIQFNESFTDFRPEINKELIVYNQNNSPEEQGEVAALDRETGEKLLQEKKTRLLGFYENKLLLESNDGCYIYDTSDGSRKETPWLNEISGEIERLDEIELASGDAIAIAYSGEGIVALDRETGKELWKRDEGKILSHNQNEGLLFLAKENDDGYIFVDGSTGKIKKEYNGNILSIHSRDKVYIGHENVIKLVDCTTGEKLWEYEHKEKIDNPTDFELVNRGTREDLAIFRYGDICTGVDRQTGEERFRYHVAVVRGDRILAATPGNVVVSNLNSMYTGGPASHFMTLSPLK